MHLGGLAKMTLLDFPGRVAATVFTAGCGMRCPFCHNASLVTHVGEPLPTEEFFSFLEKRRGLLEGVCISGGEPLLQPDIEEFIQRIRALGYAVKLDTNGMYPEKLSGLIDKGLLDYVAMDIKNSREKYAQTAGLPSFPAGVERSVSLLLSGVVPYEFRTTVVDELHRPEDFEAMGRWIAGAKAYFLQPFTDRESVPYAGLHAPTRENLEKYASIARVYVPYTSIRGL